MKLVIIDDNDINLELFAELAGDVDAELEVLTFVNPTIALESCRKAMPDLLLVDYLMPEMNGHQVIAAIRALPAGRAIPIVMVTAAEERRVRQEALERGATDFLTKPIDPHEVKARLCNLLELRRSHLRLEDSNARLAEEVRKATRLVVQREEEIILRLAKAAEFRDPETGGHIQRMAHYSALIAGRLGLDREFCELILLASPMHDVGKLATPDGILLKPGRLDAAEFTIMKRHAEIGYKILNGSASRGIIQAADIAWTHHEKFDGSGYPRGLAGEDIPLAGRIVAVADVFDALTSERPYKRAWPLNEARAFLAENAGSHFDPTCVAAFLGDWDAVLDIAARFADEELSSESLDSALPL